MKWKSLSLFSFIFFSITQTYAPKRLKHININIVNKFTKNQQTYINYLQNNDNLVIVEGPAGTGKTFIACNYAIEALKEKKTNKIILTRPVVSVEEDIGYLPGTLNNKMDPWTRPIFDIFEETVSKSQIEIYCKNGQIEISPLGFMRGRTFKNAIIIADEMQNSSPNQMFMLLTRLGENSKMIITGDLHQTDKLQQNGLKDLIDRYHQSQDDIKKNIHFVYFDHNDVSRSKLVKQILSLYSQTSNVKYDKREYHEKKPDIVDEEKKPDIVDEEKKPDIVDEEKKTDIVDEEKKPDIVDEEKNEDNIFSLVEKDEYEMIEHAVYEKEPPKLYLADGFQDAALIPKKYFKESFK